MHRSRLPSPGRRPKRRSAARARYSRPSFRNSLFSDSSFAFYSLSPLVERLSGRFSQSSPPPPLSSFSQPARRRSSSLSSFSVTPRFVTNAKGFLLALRRRRRRCREREERAPRASRASVSRELLFSSLARGLTLHRLARELRSSVQARAPSSWLSSAMLQRNFAAHSLVLVRVRSVPSSWTARTAALARHRHVDERASDRQLCRK